jgi:hypothetical protein
MWRGLSKTDLKIISVMNVKKNDGRRKEIENGEGFYDEVGLGYRNWSMSPLSCGYSFSLVGAWHWSS